MSARAYGLTFAFAITAIAAAVGGYNFAQRAPVGQTSSPAMRAADRPAAPDQKRVLYWYDPMVPAQRFNAPGKSPFMDMQLVPKYAGESVEGTVHIDAAVAQNLGMRLATVINDTLPMQVDAVGTLVFNERDRAIVQARADAFVERVYDRAPQDIVPRGAPLVDLLVPSWTAAGTELLALRAHGDLALLAAARARFRLLGAPPELIARVETGGKAEARLTVRAPIAGVIQALDVRNGMTVSAGDTLASINGLDPVWLEAAVPERALGEIGVGDPVTAMLRAFPGKIYTGQVIAILPQARLDTRTVTVRTALDNTDARLRPGMFAEVRIEAGEARPALLVPSEAVIRTGLRTLVYIATDNGNYQPRIVRTGREQGGRTEITEGLTEGEQVVASGQFLLDSTASLGAVLPVTNNAMSSDVTPEQPPADTHNEHNQHADPATHATGDTP